MAQNTNFKGNKNNNQKKKLPYIKVKIDKIISLEENNKVMEAYHQSLDEQQAESETENMSEDESENFLQSM